MKQNILFLAGLLLLALPATAAVGNVAKSYTEPNDTAVTLSSTDTVAPTADFILNISELLSDTMPEYTVNPLFLPLVFEKQEVTPYEKLEVEQWNNHRLTYDVDTLLPRNDKWLSLATREAGRVEAARNYVIVNCPYLVKYNLDNLPEIPKQYMIVNDPTKQPITIVERPITPVTELQAKPVKIKRWLFNFNSAIQFSMVYISDNWYQGGQSSLSLLSDQLLSLKYNDPSGKVLFENALQWKVNLTTSEEDTVHKVRVGEDVLQLNSKFGYKAFSNWYYSASLQFKTQVLTNYASNSNDIQAEFLSPSELNVGLGLSYQHSYEKPVKLSHTLTLSPLSYNLKFLALHHMDPTRFGIETGWAKNEIGSSLDYTITWNLRYNIQWSSHLFAFTNYNTSLVEWTNTFDFAFSTYFSARVYVDVRYDDSVAPDPRLGYFQIKNLLSLGFSYKI